MKPNPFLRGLVRPNTSDVTNVALPGFPGGLFVAISDGKVFHHYAWDDLALGDARKSSSAASQSRP